MRESFGSTWTMQIMFGFTLLFVAFITVMISYSKAFRIKNEVISIIEKYGGYNDAAAEKINNYLRANSYEILGNCEYTTGDNALGVAAIGGAPTNYNPGTRYHYCVKKETVRNTDRTTVSDIHYEVTTFYSFNIPIFGRFATFAVKGKTTDMIDPNDSHSNRRQDLFH